MVWNSTQGPQSWWHNGHHVNEKVINVWEGADNFSIAVLLHFFFLSDALRLVCAWIWGNIVNVGKWFTGYYNPDISKTLCSTLSKEETRRKWKRRSGVEEWLKAIHYHFLPQISKFKSSGPAQYDKLQINRKFRMLVASMLLITSASVIYLLQAATSIPPSLLLLFHLVFQGRISYKYSTTQYNLLPLSVTRRRPWSQPVSTPALDVVAMMSNNRMNATSSVIPTN